MKTIPRWWLPVTCPSVCWAVGTQEDKAVQVLNTAQNVALIGIATVQKNAFSIILMLLYDSRVFNKGRLTTLTQTHILLVSSLTCH